MGKPDLEERSLSYAELVKAKGELVVEDLVDALRDGRAVVRANAALGLAALGHTGGDLLPFLRDAEPHAARAVAEAIAHLGLAQRANLVKIAAALDGARPEVVDTVVTMFSELIGNADAELVGVLDTSETIVANAIVEACARAGLRGLKLLQAAAKDERPRVRLNAVRGVGELAFLEPVSSIEVMHAVAYEDDIPDARARGQAVLAAFLSRTRAEAAAKAGLEPPAVPELQERALTPDELKAAAGVAGLSELLRALGDARVEIRLNGVRVLALQAATTVGRAPALAVAANDADRTVRLECVRALGALGLAGVQVAPALVLALGDADAEVAAAAEAALVGHGEAAATVLLDSLDVASEARGVRIAGVIGRLADGPRLLREALGAHSIDVKVHAALGLGALGKARAGDALLALTAATRGGNARVRAAVVKAVAMIDPRPDGSVPPLAVDGFDERVLAEAELAKARDALAAGGVAALAPRLADARAAVRANAALALGILGDTPGVVDALAVCLRDDAAEVRMSAARALARLGEGAVAACAGDLVRALRGADGQVAALIAALLRTHAHAAIDAALARGLETSDEGQARQVLELVCARPAAVELLSAAFERDGAQANAARGFAMLGKEKLGTGRAVLERARTGSSARARELARATLLAIDGPPVAPQLPAVAGFDNLLLDHGAFGGGGLDAGAVLAFVADARPLVRANVATALGSLGAAGVANAASLAALLRDDDARVRMAAASALERLGEGAITACAADVVRALRSADAPLTAKLTAMVRASASPAIGAALVRALDTVDEHYAGPLLELVCARPAAVELLCEAFERPGAQASAARGFVMLGKEKLGRGRAVLERARIDPEARVRELARATLLAIDGPPATPRVPDVPGFEVEFLGKGSYSGSVAGTLDVGDLVGLVIDGRAPVRANAATALGVLGAAAAPHAITIAALLRDDDDRVRIAAARALDALGDDAVIAAARYLVSALRGDPAVADVVRGVLAARGAKVEAALVAGLETSDETHGLRIADLICALPNARDLLFAAIDGEAQNVQINAALGIGKLGAKRAGPEGRRRLTSYLPGPPTRRRYAMLKALEMLGPEK